MLFGLEAVGALEHPVGGVFPGQSVDIERRAPRRRGGAEVVQRRVAPNAAHMVGVLPEIVDAIVQLARRGHAVARFANGQGLGEERLVVRIGLQRGARCRVLLFDPGQRARAVHVLEPLVRVGLGAGVHVATPGLRGERGQSEKSEQAGQAHEGPCVRLAIGEGRRYAHLLAVRARASRAPGSAPARHGTHWKLPTRSPRQEPC
jgi:hypothetical protein